VKAQPGLARAQLQLGDPAAALAMTAVRPDLPFPAEEPAMRLLEGLALLELNRPEESARAFSDPVTATDALLTLADRKRRRAAGPRAGAERTRRSRRRSRPGRGGG
jgi:hypothetical protein